MIFSQLMAAATPEEAGTAKGLAAKVPVVVSDTGGRFLVLVAVLLHTPTLLGSGIRSASNLDFLEKSFEIS